MYPVKQSIINICLCDSCYLVIGSFLNWVHFFRLAQKVPFSFDFAYYMHCGSGPNFGVTFGYDSVLFFPKLLARTIKVQSTMLFFKSKSFWDKDYLQYLLIQWRYLDENLSAGSWHVWHSWHQILRVWLHWSWRNWRFSLFSNLLSWMFLTKILSHSIQTH